MRKKKLVSMFLAVGMALSMMACGGAAQDSAGESSQAAKEDSGAAAGDTITLQ